jgi:hypothetical protein
MCDASDYTIRAIFVQRNGMNLNVIQYSSRMLDEDQKNCYEIPIYVDVHNFYVIKAITPMALLV